jgi:hypothetical protein
MVYFEGRFIERIYRFELSHIISFSNYWKVTIWVVDNGLGYLKQLLLKASPYYFVI